jgi:hypothetical protein
MQQQQPRRGLQQPLTSSDSCRQCQISARLASRKATRPTVSSTDMATMARALLKGWVAGGRAESLKKAWVMCCSHW